MPFRSDGLVESPWRSGDVELSCLLDVLQDSESHFSALLEAEVLRVCAAVPGSGSMLRAMRMGRDFGLEVAAGRVPTG